MTNTKLTMKYLRSIVLFSVLVVLLPVSCSKKEQTQPNIVIIQLDDLGYDDLATNGNLLIETPFIDSFANSAMRFEQFYVNPVCAPSRASLLTGRHFLRTGVSHVHGGMDFINRDETLIGEVLQDAGYKTGMWGKWHSGHTNGYFPWQRGFDEAYMAALYKHRNSFGLLNGEEVKHSKWADEVITSYAIDFISRNRQGPFFAYLSYLSVHAPLETPDSLKIKYVEKGLSPNLATIYGMVEHVDHYIGKLLNAIDTMGLGPETLIMIMSDNGPAVLNDLLTDEDRRIRYVSGMKGQKGNIWENGVRSPFLIKWQGVTQTGFCHQLIDITDIFPTVTALAGVESGSLPKATDGIDFSEFITCGNAEAIDKVSYNYANRGWPPTKSPWSPEGVLDEYRPVTESGKMGLRYEDQILSVRKGAFKLMHSPGKVDEMPAVENGYVLVDILADPREENNLYSVLPDVSEEMSQLLKFWWQSILNEPASFRMPVYTVGSEYEEITVIPAKGPRQISPGVTPAFAWLTGWLHPGDFAEYSIDIKENGLYEISLLFQGRPNGARVRVSAGNNYVENNIELYDRATLGSMEMDTSMNILRVELMQNTSATEVFARLEGIELKKR